MNIPNSPMLFSDALHEVPNLSENFVGELKHDGGRAWLKKSSGKTSLFMSHNNGSSNEDVIFRYPEFEHNGIPDETLLDGEVAVIGSNGRDNFERFLSRKGLKLPLKVRMAARQFPATFWMIDVVQYRGEEVWGKPLSERIEIKKRVAQETDNPSFRAIEATSDIGELFRETFERGDEGIVVKRLDTPYVFGISNMQLKIKHLEEADFRIAGFTSKTRDISSLILQRPDGSYALKVNCTTIFKDSYPLLQGNIDSAAKPLPNFPKSPDESVFWLKPESRLVAVIDKLKGTNRFPVLKEIRQVV